ncbi:MAG: alpha/beta fold hydrolase [Hyphomicrobiaceae bacterium]|nr:alpha/beta fold hydrolase [Hyphomicrobiaceae bacterium]MCC0007584.1 alpha/beta fold hydrolase [Hyphomicrobiaceae bacterium]
MTTTTDTTYRIKGGRVGVLLIHGLCGTPVEMRYVAHGLARSGYTVHCPLIAGHGGGENEIKASTWRDWLTSAEAALDELRKECDVVICSGLSTGALLSLMLAAKHPDKVQGIAPLAPTLWLNGWLIPWYARLFRLVRHNWVADLISFPDIEPHGIKDDRIRDFIRKALTSGDSSVAGLPVTPGRAVLEHHRLVRKLKGMLSAIVQPTMIIHPREDDYADLSNAWYLQRNLKGRVDMVVLDDSYHIVTVDRQRHVVVERMLSFIDRLAGEFAGKVTTAATASIAPSAA